MQEMTLKGPKDLEQIGAIRSTRNQGVDGRSVAVGDILSIPEDVSLNDAWYLIRIGKAEPYIDPDTETSQEGNDPPAVVDADTTKTQEESDPPTGIPEKIVEDIKDNLTLLENEDYTEDGFPKAEAVNKLLKLTDDDLVTQEDINSINELKKTEE